MRILIANDDGYLAPGLAALVKACEGLGDLEIVARVYCPAKAVKQLGGALPLIRQLRRHRISVGVIEGV